MRRYNPLFQTANSKRSVEVIRPQIIQNTINQTSDNVVIEKLNNNKILIAMDDKITSSHYDINAIFNEVYKNLPEPLVAGSNIEILNGKIHSKMYDDTDLRKHIKNTEKETNDLITDISQNTVELKKLINLKCDNLSVQQISILEELNTLTKRQKILKSLLDDNAQYFGEENRKLHTEISDVKKNTTMMKDDINKKMKEMDNDNKKCLDSMKLLIDNNDKNHNKNHNDMNEKLQKYSMDVDNKIEYNKELLDENANKLYVDIQNYQSNMEEKLINNFKKMIDDVCNKYDDKLQKKEQEITRLTKMVETLNVDVVSVKNLDPSSKQLQKVIKQLTDKVSLIDKHFKFTTNNSV